MVRFVIERSGWLIALMCVTSVGAEPTVEGEWKTSLGAVRFKGQGDGLTATFAGPGGLALKGSVSGKTVTLRRDADQREPTAIVTVDDSGRAFSGWFQHSANARGPWNGWRAEPAARGDGPGHVHGLWLGTLGLMELTETGNKVTGRFALRGTSKLEGEITGRHLDFSYQAFQKGRGWFDITHDGSKLEGAASDDGTDAWFGWQARPAAEFRRHVPFEPGKIVDGSTTGLLTYSIRAPDGYHLDYKKLWPAIVILHGSNMNGRAYVATLASIWPELGRDYVIVGINGERPSKIGPEPAFNYTYVNYVGRSKHHGFPGTDRESPALVADALNELKQIYPLSHYFVGGHSQGGFSTYSLLMNSPELVAGAFPISAGLIFQCEPGAYDDESLKRVQRSKPVAVVHGKGDPMVGFGMGQYAVKRFLDAGWPAIRLFASDDGGHMLARLPVGEAIHWLETMTSNRPEILLNFAQKAVETDQFRDALAVLERARRLSLDHSQLKEESRLTAVVEAKARAGAQELLDKIHQNKSNSWVDGFLAFRDQFATADAAREVMNAFESLRSQHEPKAQAAMTEARQAFQQGNRDAGFAHYQEIIDQYYASSLYQTAREVMANRK